MDPADLIALMTVTGASLFLVVVAARLYTRRLAFKERKMELLANQTAEKAAQYAAHTERLEARVQVLERIATDKGTDLAAQIEDLRKSSVN